MIDLLWNFPLLAEQQAVWARHLAEATEAFGREGVESLRPSFRTADGGLRARAARLLGFAEERIWLTCGNHHGTLMALLAAELAGTRMALDAVSYPGFMSQCRLTKTEMTGVAVDGEGMLPEALRAACAAAKAEGRPLRGAFLMPSVQNPLGFVMSTERCEAIAAVAREFDLTIVVDDAYGYLVEEQPMNFAELAPERTYYVRGLAKSFAPGARTGFLVAPASAAEAVAGVLVVTSTGTDVPANYAALALCEDGSLETLMEAKRVEGRARNAAVRELLAEAGFPATEGAAAAWHVWVPLPERVDLDALVAAMAEAGVLMSSGKFSEVSPGAGQGVRVALGAEVERGRVIEGVRRLAGYLRGV